MNRHQKHPQPRCKAPAYRQAFERLNEALYENPAFDNRKKIRLMRRAMFADVDELEKSGRLKLPKP
jgi:hypothetical protein